MARFTPGKPGGSKAIFRRSSSRFGLGILFFSLVIILAITFIDHPVAERIREETGDILRPVMTVATRPADWFRTGQEALGSYLSLREVNERLREENARLQEWRAVAERLDVQNQRLRDMLNARPVDIDILGTFHVLAVSGGPYVRSVLINGGRIQGLQENLPVVDQRGLVGRLILVGDRGSRVLLLNDLNSRVPVRNERSGDRAIAIGSNTEEITLAFMPVEPDMAIGDRIFTTGDGGIFPPGLLVGVISGIDAGRVRALPAADLADLQYLRVLDYDPSEFEPAEQAEEQGAPEADLPPGAGEGSN